MKKINCKIVACLLAFLPIANINIGAMKSDSIVSTTNKNYDYIRELINKEVKAGNVSPKLTSIVYWKAKSLMEFMVPFRKCKDYACMASLLSGSYKRFYLSTELTPWCYEEKQSNILCYSSLIMFAKSSKRLSIEICGGNSFSYAKIVGTHSSSSDPWNFKLVSICNKREYYQSEDVPDDSDAKNDNDYDYIYGVLDEEIKVGNIKKEDRDRMHFEAERLLGALLPYAKEYGTDFWSPNRNFKILEDGKDMKTTASFSNDIGDDSSIVIWHEKFEKISVDIRDRDHIMITFNGGNSISYAQIEGVWTHQGLGGVWEFKLLSIKQRK